MINKNWPITVDFDHGTSFRPMQFVHSDYGSCSITFTTVQGITGLTVRVAFALADGNFAILDADIEDENTAILDLTSGVLSVIGRVECQVALYDDSGRLTNPIGFFYEVLEDLSETAVPASDQYPILTQLIEDCEAIEDAEVLRIAAEGAADPKSGRVGAEINRAEAEEARLLAEGDALSGRIGAEIDRTTAEEARLLAEGDALSGRIKAENDRVTAEEARALAEGDALSGRIKAENDRSTAEEARASAENARKIFEVYNAATTYVVGNKVVYNGSTYSCIQSGTGKTPNTEITYWLLIASGGSGTSVITGYAEAATNAQITAADTINQAFGKAQKQLNDNTGLISTNVGDLETLTTTDKSSLVNATNEVKNLVDTNTQFTDVDNVVYSWRFIKSAEGHMQLEYTEVI